MPSCCLRTLSSGALALTLALSLALGCSRSSAPAERGTAHSAGAAVTAAPTCEIEAPGERADTRLVYLGDVEATYGETVALSAQLTDASGNGLAGQLVHVQLGEDGASAFTDDRGVVELTLPAEAIPGALALGVEYVGDTAFSPSVLEGTFTLRPASTRLALEVERAVSVGGTRELRARLTRPDGTPIAGRIVQLELAGRTGAGVTDGAGLAVASVDAPRGATGPTQVNAAFAGDARYLASSAAAEVVRYAQTGFVIWGGNTPGLRIGDRINFWGHSWENQVTGGDYDAHVDLKGHAETVEVFGVCQPTARRATAPLLGPGCWSAKGGQTWPPEQVADFIGVIVTTSVTKSGSDTYGNVAALAVLHVLEQPEYGWDPGKPGYGVLVDVIEVGVLPTLEPLPAVEIAQSQPAAGLPGDALAVLAELTNPTPATASDVRVDAAFGGTLPEAASAAAGSLAPGERRALSFEQAVPLVATRGEGETVEAYLARLAAIDGRALASEGTVRFADLHGRETRPASSYSSTRLELPRLAVGLSAPGCVAPGSVIPYRVTVHNLGLGTAADATARVRFPDGIEDELVLTALAAGASETHTLEWTVPAVAPRGPDESELDYAARLDGVDGTELVVAVELVWSDARGNPYGVVDQVARSLERVPVLIAAAEPLPLLLPSQPVAVRIQVRNAGGATALAGGLRVQPPEGAPVDAAPFELGAGEARTVEVASQATAFAPRSTEEDEAAYSARLAASVRLPLAFGFGLGWSDAAGGAYGPAAGTARTLRVLPSVDATLGGPASARAGDAVRYVLTFRNLGAAEATAAAAAVELPGGVVRAVPAPGPLAPGASSTLEIDHVLPATLASGTATVAASVTWKDALGSGYGPVTARAETAIERSNAAPVVDAGPDQTITLPADAALHGAATDDGLPEGQELATRWIPVSGPGEAAIAYPGALETTVAFPAAGTYVLRLVADDSQLTAYDELTVTVLPREGTGGTVGGGGTAPGEDLINVVRDGNVFRLDNAARAFRFVWVAVSSKGTIVKIDTDTGKVLGEYWSSPSGQPKDPSRTTVDKNGNVWASNRAGHSVLRIGLAENGQCIDRNLNGVIDTSTGLGDVRAWTNAGGVDTDGGADTAADECVLDYVLVRSSGTRHVSVDENNDVWVSGTGGRYFDLIDGRTAQIVRNEPTVGYGGYGGLIDPNGVIWSARPLLRWDTSKPLTGVNGVNWKGYSHDSYGLCIDSKGYVWNTALNGNLIYKFAPDGTLAGSYAHGDYYAQGCVVDGNDDVWVAHSLYRSTVGHLKNDGTYVGNVTVGNGPTGVAVDRSGKIWATNYGSRTVSRIDPSRGATGADGQTPVGQQDLATVDLGGNLYNYSDMTGSTLSGAPENGTFSMRYDGETPGAAWGRVSWNGQVCGDGGIFVTAATSEDGVTFGSSVPAHNGQPLAVPNGRYLKVTVSFTRSSKGQSPELYDLTVGTLDWVHELPSNGAPSVDAGRDREHTLPGALRLSGGACDDALPGLDPLALSWTQGSGPGTATFSAPHADRTDVSFTAPGTYVLRLTASDGELESSDDLTVTVVPANGTPVVQVGPTVVLNLPETAALEGAVVDDGLPAPAQLTTTWSKLSGPGTVTFADAASPRTTASFDAAGTYVLRLVAFDGHLTASADLTVVANAPPPVDRAPVVSAGPNLSIPLGGTANLLGEMSDDGLPAGSTASVTWSKVSGPGSVTFGNTHLPATTARFSLAGVYVLRLSATDGSLTSSADMSVAVNAPAPANAPPVVSAGPNLAVTLPERAVLAGSVVDDELPEGSTLSVSWSRVSGPGTVTFTAPSSATTEASFSAAGTYVLRLTASDGQFRATSDVYVLASAAAVTNEAPVANAGPSQAITLPTRTVLLAGTVSDDGRPTGAQLTIGWTKTSGPGEVSFASSKNPSTNATFSAPGTYVLRLTASDTKLAGASETTIRVDEAPAGNKAPVVSAGAEVSSVRLPVARVYLTQSATDDGLPVGGALQLSWEQVSGPGPASFANELGRMSVEMTVPGDYVLRFSATDGELRSSALVAIQVLPDLTNRPPVVSASAPDLVL